MKRSLLSMVMALSVFGTVAQAESPAAIAKSEHLMSAKIYRNYLNNRDTRSELNQLIRLHQQLKAQHPTAEKANLVRYLELCIVRLRSTLRTQPTPQSIATVRNLTRQIQEGSRYIASR